MVVMVTGLRRTVRARRTQSPSGSAQESCCRRRSPAVRSRSAPGRWPRRTRASISFVASVNLVINIIVVAERGYGRYGDGITAHRAGTAVDARLWVGRRRSTTLSDLLGSRASTSLLLLVLLLISLLLLHAMELQQRERAQRELSIRSGRDAA